MLSKSMLFDRALKYYGISKKQYCVESDIAYNTVVGWKKRNEIPSFAFIILKKIITDNKLQFNKYVQASVNIDMSTKLERKVQATLWGKNYDSKKIITEVKKGNSKFVKPFFENLYYKDIIYILGIKGISKLIPKLKILLPKMNVDFWESVADMENTYAR